MYKRLFAAAAVTVAGLAMAVGAAEPALAAPAVSPGWHDTGRNYGPYLNQCQYDGGQMVQNDPSVNTYDCRLQSNGWELWVQIS